MSPTETAATLRQFIDWRRDTSNWPPSPMLIEKAIDAAIEMIDRLEAAEKERDKLKELNSALRTNSNSQVIHNARLAEENYALRARIEAMEKQEPVAFALYSGWARKAVYLSETEACEQRDHRQLTADLGGSLEAYRVAPLYLAPGAQTQGERK